MIPFGDETVTLVRRTLTPDENGRNHAVYSTELLTGCSWRRTTRIVRNGEALLSEERAVCRVPAGQTKPMPGDLLIHGARSVNVESGAEYNRLLEETRDSDGAMVVTSVKDNARPGMPLPHYAVSG